MAPKPRQAISKRTVKRNRTGRVDDGSSGSHSNAPDFTIHETNRYLFRDIKGYENFIFLFQNRELSDCYFFNKASVTFRYPEDDKLIAFINHWSWNSLLSCDQPFTKILTRLFYANLTIQETPFILSSWICGQEITLSLGNIANWLELVNDGEETYILRHWTPFAIDTPDHYKEWFDRNNRGGGALYAPALPSLHRLLFTFINNILIPKATLKTNIEWGPMYYLRHLIQMDDKTFNLPYIILRHMKSVFISRVARLPYANIIHKIILANGIVLPEDQEYGIPNNLVDYLTKLGWNQMYSDSGLPYYGPDQREINTWINAQNALPNQYWDPQEIEQQEIPVQASPVQEPQPQPNPQAAQFVLPQGSDAQLAWLCQHLHYNHLENQEIIRGMAKVQEQVTQNSKDIGILREAQQSLTSRFIGVYGASSSAIPRAQQNVDEDIETEGGDEDEEMEVENQRDEEVQNEENPDE